jgi:ATP:ADP antiporter, AAA family
MPRGRVRMPAPEPDSRSAILTATLCAATVSAHFIAAKATRDAIYLGTMDVQSLPAIVMATAVVSIALVGASTWAMRFVRPAIFVPLTFLVNAAFLLLSWLLAPRAPALTAQAIYLLISGLGPMLGSGFWLIASEHFDPHTARRTFGRIASLGTLSGLAGALVTERVAALYGATAMLPLLATLSLFGAWQVRRLATQTARESTRTASPSPASPQSGLRVLAEQPYLRNLALLVLLGTISATLADYVFKATAVQALGRGDALLRFFAIYYAATSLLSFAVQAGLSTAIPARFGLAVTAATPSFALAAGSIGALVVPGLEGATAARGSESIMRGSLFRTAYEIFFTPIPAGEKRAAKAIIDVACDRLGDGIGGGLIRLLILLPAASQRGAVLTAVLACSVVAIIVARRLSAGYVHTLGRSLVNRALELDLSDIEDLTTRTTLLRTLTDLPTLALPPALPTPPAARSVTESMTLDPDLADMMTLRSRNAERVTTVLRREPPLAPALVPHVIPLLAWDAVAEDAVRALRGVAEEHVGELIDAIIDPNQPFAVRRRLARVFSVCVSQRAADGLMLGLDDIRFEVRFQCGRSLAGILEKNALVRIDRARIFEVVRREVAVSRPVWEGHRLLDRVDDQVPTLVDDFLKDRASQSLAHVFTLLSLVLPATPLQIAYRGLHTSDVVLRGTALEYLEGVLPPDIRDRLRPFLGEQPAARSEQRPQEQILAELLRSNDSILLNLEELRRRAAAGVS